MNKNDATSFNDGLSPNGKIFNVDEAYQAGLITLSEKEEAVGRLITVHLERRRIKMTNQETNVLQDHNKLIKSLRKNILQTEVENKKEDKMIFIKAVINGEVIAGNNIERVLRPTSESSTWQIILKGGSTIEATGNISVWTTKDKNDET